MINKRSANVSSAVTGSDGKTRLKRIKNDITANVLIYYLPIETWRSKQRQKSCILIGWREGRRHVNVTARARE